MRIDFIVLGHTLEDLLSMAEQIQKQSVLPDFVAFGFIEERKGYHDTTLASSADLNKAINSIMHIFNGEIKFTVTRVLDTICYYRCIDICVKKCKGTYYSVLLADCELPDYFNFQLDAIVSSNKTYMIQPSDGLHGLVVYRNLHKHLGGSVSFDDQNEPYLEKITDKILNYAKKEMIYEWQN